MKRLLLTLLLCALQCGAVDGVPTALTTGTFSAGSTITTSLALTTGDFLVVCAQWGTTRTLTSIVWNSINLSQDVIVGTTGKSLLASLYIASGTTANLVITISAGANGTSIPMKITGMASATTTDQVKSQAQVTTTSPSSTATPNTTQATETAIGCLRNDTTTISGSWSNSFTNLSELNSGTTTGDTGYLVLSSTGAQTAAKTGATSANYSTVIATYKAAVVASNPKRLTTLGIGFALLNKLFYWHI